MKMSFWSHCHRLILRLQQSRAVPRPRLRRQPSWVVESLEARMLLSSTPAMVADINPGAAASSPTNLVAIGSTTCFSANDGVHGAELWKSDGTPAGTVIVKDINPGSASSGPGDLINVNGTLFFTASDGTNGRELWKSDGTAAGTMMVEDINPGSAASYGNNLINLNGTLFFTATDTTGYELWKSDGTADGTAMIKDINPGSASSYTSYLTNVNGTLFFTADDGTEGRELWKSDGTAAGTVMIKDINTGSASSYTSYLTNVNGTLFFNADDGTEGRELWKSDGTAAGTTLVKDIFPGGYTSYYGGYYLNSSNPRDLTNVNGTLFFTADDSTSSYELWQSDGTAAGTVMVSSSVISPTDLTNVNGTLFFSASDGVLGWELWQSDGTAAGTAMVKDISPPNAVNGSFASSNPSNLTNVNGTLFFGANDGSNGAELWKSDGTAAGTVMVANINPGGAYSSPSNLTNVNGTLMFTANDGTHGTELWTLNTAPAPSLDVSGFPTTTMAGAAGSFTVTARNADGTTNTVYADVVHFTSTDPQAVLPADYTFTAADAGVHTFSATLKTAGTQSLTAMDTQTPAESATEGRILVQPAGASTMTVAGFPSPVTAGVAGSLTVTLRDAYGNIASGYTGTLHFSSTDAKATLPANYTLTAADAGKHSFSAALKTAGTQSISVADTTAASVTGTDGNITVNPAAAGTMTVAGFPLPVTAGVAGSLTVTLRDAYGNIASGYTGTLHFTSSDSKATLPANYTLTAADAGKHTFSATLKTAGTQSFTVVDIATSVLTSTKGDITVNPGAASQFVISAPSSVKPGVPFSLTLEIEDTYGNVVTGYTGTVHVTSTDDTALLPGNYTFTAADKGVHTFAGLVLRKNGKQKITITDTLNSSLTGSVTEKVH